jgi:hypothetical protein
MSKSLVAFSIGLALASLAPSASAELRAANLEVFAVWEQPEQCAVSLKVSDSVGGMTDGTEKLSLGASYSYTLGSTFSSKTLDAGKYVLFASPSFASATKATPDVTIPDADCGDFTKSGGKISFDGSMGKHPGLFELTVPADFGPKRALTGGGTLTDLELASVMLYGFTGSWPLGLPGGSSTTGGGSDDDGGGCAVRSVPRDGRGAGPLALVLAGAAMLVTRRRKQRAG